VERQMTRKQNNAKVGWKPRWMRHSKPARASAVARGWGIDAEAQGNHRRVVWARVLSFDNQPVESAVGRGTVEFAGWALEEDYPHLIVDARYEKVRENDVIWNRAVLIAIGVNWDGRRRVLGVELAISDDHAWQRRYVHFLRKADDDCLMELRWL
jgi:hypothetical protein